MPDKQYFVYILTNQSGTLYVGKTSDLVRRIREHKSNLIAGFTQKYKLHNLVYYENAPNAMSALARERQLKGWLRRKKIKLINKMNPEWKDLGQKLTNIQTI